MSGKENKFKNTLNLPKTNLPIKVNMNDREQELLKFWDDNEVYEKTLESRDVKKSFTLHDGPPYANGHIHYGHILNKVLKDIIVKSKTMNGSYSVLKPGWDCHGLPIELAVLRHTDVKDKSPVGIRNACSDYAKNWVETQKNEFKRLGVFATWDDPYLTLDNGYEAAIVRQLAKFARNNLLYQEKKPVHWCMSCKTALAEAEIEYDENHTSPSVYVKFPFAGTRKLFFVVWTTTPWTLPANYAIAFNPDMKYVFVHANDEMYLVAEDLADSFVKECSLTETRAREPVKDTGYLHSVMATHPFANRTSVLLPSDHVKNTQGTGLVHIAPCYGGDDYTIGKKYDLPIDAPLTDGGLHVGGQWDGEYVFKSNPKIVAHLKDAGYLLSNPTDTVKHAYPVCWRCKKPVIVRTTKQWFASVDKPLNNGKTLRNLALDAIKNVNWIPEDRINRISGMLETRPDWVLSRQRAWGVPIPVFYKDGEVYPKKPKEMAMVMEYVAHLIEKNGSNVWFEKDANDLLPPQFRTDGVTKGNDIVDVWFESGVSWLSLCNSQDEKEARESRAPLGKGTGPQKADLYLEGSDQHRGWFQSSLLATAVTTGEAPYKSVLTHGFVLDNNGVPYSKTSLENAKKAGIKTEYIEPEAVIKEHGAEVLRLWVASSDFKTDITYSRNHLNNLVETSRKIKNTLRYILSNLDGFDPNEAVPVHLWTTDDYYLEKYILNQTNNLYDAVREAYEKYEFHTVVKLVTEFCVNELSSLLFDVRKDRLYCDKLSSNERKATQAVMYYALRVILAAMAPIMPFTTEDIWSHMPKKKKDTLSVHQSLWPEKLAILLNIDRGSLAFMARLLDLRKEVQAALEPFRAQKHKSLDAEVTITMPEAFARDLFNRQMLEELFIVSKVYFDMCDSSTFTGANVIKVEVKQAPGYPCERCHKYISSPSVCDRCFKVLND